MTTSYELRRLHLFNDNVEIEHTKVMKSGAEAPRCRFYNLQRGVQCVYQARANGYCGGHAHSEFLSTREAAQILRVTDRTVRSVLGQPDERVKLTGGRVAFGWRADRVQALIGTLPPYIKRARKDYLAIFRHRYGGFDAALPDACAMVFNLNRYAKHFGCKQQVIEEIYQLKGKLIDALIKRGHLVAAWPHTLRQDAKECFSCDKGHNDEGGRCFRCGGTGIYLKARNLHFICLRFVVDGKIYTWHQRRDRMLTEIELSNPPAGNDWIPAYDQPVNMGSKSFTEGLALIRWIVEVS